MLAWMYVVPVAMFFFGKGRGYYLAAAYPMLLAMGAAAGERWMRKLFLRSGRAGRWIAVAPFSRAGGLRSLHLRRL